MTWTNLLANKEAQKHKTSKKELDNMRALLARDLADAGIAGLSPDRKCVPDSGDTTTPARPKPYSKRLAIRLPLYVHADGVVAKPLSDTSLCFKTCVILRADNTSRLIDEYVRMFLRRYSSQRLPPKQVKSSPSAQVLGWKTPIPPSRP